MLKKKNDTSGKAVKSEVSSLGDGILLLLIF